MIGGVTLPVGSSKLKIGSVGVSRLKLGLVAGMPLPLYSSPSPGSLRMYLC